MHSRIFENEPKTTPESNTKKLKENQIAANKTWIKMCNQSVSCVGHLACENDPYYVCVLENFLSAYVGQMEIESQNSILNNCANTFHLQGLARKIVFPFNGVLQQFKRHTKSSSHLPKDNSHIIYGHRIHFAHSYNGNCKYEVVRFI